MQRELYEETGVYLQKCRHKVLYTRKRQHYVIQAVRLMQPRWRIRLHTRDQKEIAQVRWVPIRSAIQAYRLNGITRFFLEHHK